MRRRVSSSARTWGRPGGRRGSSVSVFSRMVIFQIILDIGLIAHILEGDKFPNSCERPKGGRKRSGPMTRHPGIFTVESPISAEVSAPGRQMAKAAPAQEAPASTKRVLRKALLIGASVLALAGVGYFGWEYWSIGRFEVSTDDAYVQEDNTTIAPKVSAYIAPVPVADNEAAKPDHTPHI